VHQNKPPLRTLSTNNYKHVSQGTLGKATTQSSRAKSLK